MQGRSAHEVRNSHGLGLVFCRRAVEVHGGDIWVDDNATRGSCFCVRLALDPGAARAGGTTAGAGQNGAEGETSAAPAPGVAAL